MVVFPVDVFYFVRLLNYLTSTKVHITLSAILYHNFKYSYLNQIDHFKILTSIANKRCFYNYFMFTLLYFHSFSNRANSCLYMVASDVTVLVSHILNGRASVC